METDEFDDLADDDYVAGHRARAAAMLDQIVQETKQTLEERGIGIAVFFIIPSSGEAILTYGTAADPDDASWQRVAEVVAPIVARLIGVDRVRHRPVACAITDPIAAAPLPTAAVPAEVDR